MKLEKIKQLQRDLEAAGYRETGKVRKYQVFERPGNIEKYFLNRRGDLRRGITLSDSFSMGKFKRKIF